MGYLSILNLYRAQEILEQPEVFALEKIHGTSSHITFVRQACEYTDNHGVTSQGNFHYHGGGISGAEFKKLFDTDTLEPRLSAIEGHKITVYGESYGGKLQKNQWRYGDTIKFVAFDVMIDYQWLTVPEAHSLATSLGLEFVHFVRIPTTLAEIDKWRDATSEQAIRNGVTTADGPFIRREGVVLRTVSETPDKRGNRLIVKHKRAEERETKTERVVDISKLEILKGARAIAEEWVTATRLQHVLDKMEGPVVDMTRTREVISAMIADVHREGAGEFEPGPTVNAEIGKRAAQLLKQYFEDKLKENES